VPEQSKQSKTRHIFVSGCPKEPDRKNQADEELVMHEVGELLVAAAISTQRESRRYQSDYGQIQLSELEVELPAMLRVDKLGQLRAKVVNEVSSSDAVARIRLRVSHLPDVPTVASPLASQSLSELSDLSDEQIAALSRYRVFTGEDIRRVTRTVAGLQAVQSMIGCEELNKVLETVEFISAPGLSPELSWALLKASIKSKQDLLKCPEEELAKKLQAITGVDVSAESISDLKRHIWSLDDSQDKNMSAK